MRVYRSWRRFALGTWIALAAVLPAVIALASQSTLRPTLYLPIILSNPAPPSPTPSPSPPPSASPTPPTTPTQPPDPPTVFGMVMTKIAPERGLDGALGAGVTWIRSGGLLWREIEPLEGAGYHWDSPALQSFEQEMILA